MKRRRPTPVNSRLRGLGVMMVVCLILISGGLIPASIAQALSAETFQSLTARLESWEVEEIWPAVQEALAREPKDPPLLELASHIAFHRGDYPEALKLMKAVMEVA